MNAKLESLEAELLGALAKDARRLATAKGEMAEKAKAKRAEMKHADAESALMAAELAKSDWRAEAYERNLSRMSAINSDIARLKREAAKGDALTVAMAEQSIEALRVELGVLYGLPIAPRDLTDHGRFAASVRYHDREVGMMAADALDVVMEAARLCYLEGNVTETVRFVRGERIAADVPTIGGMYRNLKRAQHMLIDESRRMIRNGVVPVYLSELEEMGIEPTPRAESWGFDYVDPADIPLPVLMAVDDVDAERVVLAEAKRRVERDKARARALMMERETAVTGSLPANVDTVALRLIINGMTVDQVAEKLGVTRATITRRLLALEPAGTSLTRVPAGEYGDGVEVVSMSTVREVREGWTHKGGVYASAVAVEVRG